MPNDQLFKTVRATRGYMIQHLLDLTDAQWLEVPEKAGHNILWNVGHIVDTEARLTYGQCKLPIPVPEKFHALFKGGTAPKDWTEPPSIAEVMTQLKESGKRLGNDYAAGKFAAFERIELAKGYALENIEDALAFNIFHEGTHIGMIMELRKLVGAIHKK